MDRRIIKPKRRQNQRNPSKKNEDNDNFATSTPSGSGVKRRCEDWHETPIKRSRQNVEPTPTTSPKATKYSANDRLNRYRKTLDQKKNQIVKVHKALHENTGTKQPSHVLTSRNVSVATSTTVFKNLPKKVLDSPIELQSIRLNISDAQTTINQREFDEDMDWSPINEEDLAADIRKLRDTIKPHPNPRYLNLKPGNSTFDRSLAADNPLYIVVDTNIFISHLCLLRDIAQLHQKSRLKPTIYVPWMVLQELDFFKDGRTGSRNIQSAAKRAILFINSMLTKKDKALKGQTVHEALTHDFSNSNADDSILFSCLRLQQNDSKIILLSNDQNLRSKVLVHSIEACSTATIMKVLNDLDNLSDADDQSVVNCGDPLEVTPADKIKEIFTKACIEITKGELEKAYGETIYKMVDRPPWTLEQCLSYIKRFWIPVFSLVITQKQCLKSVDDLLEYVKARKDKGLQLLNGDTEEFVKLTLTLCVYFKNCLTPYEPLMNACISEIQKTIQ